MPRFTVDTNGTLMTSIGAYYKLDYNGLDSVKGKHTTAQADVTFTSGKIKNAATLTGGTTSWLGGTTLLNSTINGNFSMSMWVNLQDTSEAGCFVHNGDAILIGPQTGWAIGVGSSSFAGNGNNLIFVKQNQASYAIAAIGGSGWHHLGFIISVSRALYSIVDGVKTQWTTDIGTFQYAATNYLTIGGQGLRPTPNYRFTGQLDEIGYWDKELSAQEVTDLYNGGAGNPLIRDFPFAFPAMP